MKQASVVSHFRRAALSLSLRRPRLVTRQRHVTRAATFITSGGNWVLVAPLVLWFIATVYVPVVAPALHPLEAWSIGLLTTLLLGVSLVGHIYAHVLATRATCSTMPVNIPLYLVGDAAQVWPVAATPQREAVVALAGPALNAVCAAIAYLLWSFQLHPYISTSMLFLAGANIAIASINLAPGFPFDGGRLARAVIWGLLDRPVLAARLQGWFAGCLVLGVSIWGCYLILRPARFNVFTGLSVLLAASILLLSLRQRAPRRWRPAVHRTPRNSPTRVLMAVLLLLGMLCVSASVLPTTQGLRAPGFAVPVEPMVSIATEHQYPPAGSFLLTAVVEQTPIVLGQWLYAQISPSAEVIPSERVVPPGISPQELMQRNHRLLERSESAAALVAMRLAGYEIPVRGEVVEVVSVVEDSPAQGILWPGDRIVNVNGATVQNVNQLLAMLREQPQDTVIDLFVEREGELQRISLPALGSGDLAGDTWTGLRLETVRYNVSLPFEVQIDPQKIVGGPSAGLMFTLTIYNLLTPEDLTGGRIIAGTGTVSPHGVVGAIGGVEQKVAAAEAANAEYFLVPHANAEAARRVARRIKVVEVATVKDAVEFLRSLPPAQQ